MSDVSGVQPSEDDSVPVLVLGTHRSGTSAVTGLLATAGGLELGDVLPPTRANIKGYFESAAVVRTHNQVLAALDRDWTCPPPDLKPEELPIEGLRDEIEALRSHGRPWGVKDPRLLFMLPLWAHLLPEVRMIAVVRDHEEVVRSLVARDGLDPGVADIITSAHIERLRVLVERFDVPVVDFSAGSDEVVRRTEEVAVGLGLEWDDGAAQDFFDASLARSRGRGHANHSMDLETVREVGAQVAVAETVSAEDLEKVLAKELATLPDDFDRYIGPRSAHRRRLVWGGLPADMRPAIEFVSTTKVAASVDPVPADDGAQVVEATQLHVVDRTLREQAPVAAVVMADVASWLPVEELPGALRLVREHVQDGGLIRIGLSTADADTARRRRRTPVTVDDVRAAAGPADMVTTSVRELPDLTVVELRALRSQTALLQALVDQGPPQTTVEVTTPPAAAAPAAAPAAAAPAAAPAAATARRSAADTRALEQARADVQTWRRRYERLQGRRSVRFVLRIAALSRPLFRLVRRFRNG